MTRGPLRAPGRGGEHIDRVGEGDKDRRWCLHGAAAWVHTAVEGMRTVAARVEAEGRRRGIVEVLGSEAELGE